MWIQVVITLALYECEIVYSHCDCFIPGKVSFFSCAMVSVLVRGSFLKDGGKMLSSSVGNVFQCV
jgi:hypothetical protein